MSPFLFSSRPQITHFNMRNVTLSSAEPSWIMNDAWAGIYDTEGRRFRPQNEQSSTDFELAIADGEGKVRASRRCHRLVLASASPSYLRPLLLDQDTESTNETVIVSSPMSITIALPSHEKEESESVLLDNLITYIYTGHLKSQDEAQRMGGLLTFLGVPFTPQLSGDGIREDKDELREDEVCNAQENKESSNLISQYLNELDMSGCWQPCAAQQQTVEQPWQDQKQFALQNNSVKPATLVYAIENQGSHSPTSSYSSTKENHLTDLNVDEDISKQILFVEVQESSSVKANQCRKCLKTFSTRKYLKFHEKNVHNSGEKLVKCDQCSKTFSDNYYLHQHVKRVHGKEKPFSCHLCGAAFVLRQDLAAHWRTHSRQHACNVCAKTYSSARGLREHMRTHTGERPYQCRVCHKRFALPKTLRVHYRQHSGERPYACAKCGKTFVQNSTLRNHLKHNHVRDGK